MSQEKFTAMRDFAARIRLETVKAIGERGFGHIGGCLSVADALAVLYGGVLRIDPANPDWEDRDRLVMSKGHAGPALYAALALKGYFPIEWLKTLNRPGTRLPSHCDAKLTPGVDMTTGSLGQGVSCAVGLALAQRMNAKGCRTYLFTGDGELDEGQVWEGALFAAHHKLSRLTWFVDHNHKQLDSIIEDIIDLGDLPAKFSAFGWHVQSVNGCSVEEIDAALATADAETAKPSCIVLNTVKGAGVPCIESIELNHHVQVDAALFAQALAELEGGRAQ